MNWEIGIDTYMLLIPCKQLITSENLLYSKLGDPCSVLCGDLNGKEIKKRGSVQFCSVAQSCLTLCHPMDCSTPGFPVNHQLPELAQTHVHHVGDAIQPSHPLSSPSPPVFNLSQHQGLFQ